MKMLKKSFSISVCLVLLSGSILIFSNPTTGAAFSDNTRVNNILSGNQVNASVAVDLDGYIHTVWEDYRTDPLDPDIFYAKSTDGGKHFLASVLVSGTNGIGSKQKHPSVAVSNNGWIHVVWTDFRDLKTSLDDRIYYARSTNGGLSFDQQGAINEGTGDWGSFVEFIRPRIVHDGSGINCILHVVWSSFDVATLSQDYGVWHDQSTDCGNNFGTDSKIVSLAVDASISVAIIDGAIGVVYGAGSGQGLDIFFILNSGSGWTDPVKVNDMTGYYGSKDPSVALRPIDSNGESSYEVHVAWADSRNMDGENPSTWHDWDIYYSRAPNFPEDIGFDLNIKVNDDPFDPLRRKEQSEPWIGLWSWGNPKITWTDWRNDPDGHRTPIGYPHNADIFYAESNDNGVTFESNVRVNDDIGNAEQSRPMLFELDIEPGTLRGFYIVWHDERDTAYDFNIYFTGHGIPVLQWCGPPNYPETGVDPEEGGRFTTFTYCVRYRSPLGDQPWTDNPTVEILKGGAHFSGPFPMIPSGWFGSPNDYLAGERYTYSTTLFDGTDYSYVFRAKDIENREAIDLPGNGPFVKSRFRSVDISGHDTSGDQLIAVGWDNFVSLFSRANGATGSYRTQDMGFIVDYVVLSEDGTYLAVLGNQRRFSTNSHAYVKLFGPIVNPSLAWPELYTFELPHSAYGIDRPFDMTRDGSLVVVGTGIVNWDPTYDIGTVYLLQTPGTSCASTFDYKSYDWYRWILSLHFSGNSGCLSGNYGGYIALGAQDGGIPKYTSGVLSISSIGDLGLQWRMQIDDAVYVVSLDSTASYYGDGVGWKHRAELREGMTGTLIPSWPNDQPGTINSLYLSSSGNYMAASRSWDVQNGISGFLLWDLPSSSPLWTYEPDPNNIWPTRLDLAIDTEAQFIIGAWTEYVYFWGAASGPAPGPNYRTRFELPDEAFFSALAMTYHGKYSAVVDDAGRLSIYSSDDTHDSFEWSFPII